MNYTQQNTQPVYCTEIEVNERHMDIIVVNLTQL